MTTTPAPTGAPSSRAVTISDLLRIVLRRWQLPLAGVLLGAGLSMAYLLVVPASYTATAAVALRLPVTNPFSYPGTGADRVVNMNVEESLATSVEVLEQVAAVTGASTSQVREALTVESPVGGQRIRFQYTAATGERARRGADTAAAAYLSLRESMYAQEREQRLDELDQRIAQAREQAAQVRDELAGATTGDTDPSTEAALAELSGLHSELAQLRDDRAEVSLVDTTPGWVTRPAERSPPSSHDRGPVLVAVGGAGGALLAAVSAWLFESLSRRVRTPADAATATGLPVLGTVRRRRRGVPGEVPEADLRYAALTLAERIRQPGPGSGLGSGPSQQVRRLVLIGPRAEPAASESVAGVLAELAGELAAAGQKVRIERPGTDPDSGAAPRVGSDPDQLGSGSAPEVVLVEAAAAERSADGARAGRGGITVLVAVQDRTRLAELHRLAGRLHQAGAEPVGVIVTGV